MGHEKRCPLCGRSKDIAVVGLMAAPSFLERLPLYRCPACGLVFTPSDGELDRRLELKP